ncbi:MAG: PspA/IM30 family protein [Planctomycetaceae bacterium]|nr:PspA/IM30 family protein [Planctomycetaceae bacterium]
MPHFSRLTDIVTCSLTEILQASDDPQTTLKEVLHEMEEGLASARRVAGTSLTNRDRLQTEIANHTAQATHWMEEARRQLTANDEAAARESLIRKREVEDLIQGLQPELQAADATYQNMLRIQKALEARHAEAQRRMVEFSGEAPEIRLESETAVHAVTQARQERQSEVDAELEALRRELGG